MKFRIRVLEEKPNIWYLYEVNYKEFTGFKRSGREFKCSALINEVEF